MDEINAGRLAMRDAFVELSDLARRAGVDEDRISELHGRFFDGNVAVKTASHRGTSRQSSTTITVRV